MEQQKLFFFSKKTEQSHSICGMVRITTDIYYLLEVILLRNCLTLIRYYVMYLPILYIIAHPIYTLNTDRIHYSF